jgi:hypothetical protein
LHKDIVKHLNCKLYYQQLQDSVETCSSVIICEIIVHLLVIVQNNKK